MHVSERFLAFNNAHQTAVNLMVRAQDRKALVEYIVLAAAVIDGFLRTGLVFHHQLVTRSSDIPLELIYQGPEDIAITERTIFKRSLEAGVIDETLFDKLGALYDDRNKVVHRYVISEIATTDVLGIAAAFQEAAHAVQEAVDLVSDQLLKAGVGMVVELPENIPELDIDIDVPDVPTPKDKHGSQRMMDYLDSPNDEDEDSNTRL